MSYAGSVVVGPHRYPLGTEHSNNPTRHPRGTDNTIYVACFTNLRDPETEKPYVFEGVTQLTIAQFQALPTVEATAVTCLAEDPYFYKDMALSNTGSQSRDADPTEAFLARVKLLIGTSYRIKPVTREYLGSLVLDPDPTEGDYRHVTIDETEDLREKIPPEIQATTLELHPHRPPGPTNNVNDCCHEKMSSRLKSFPHTHPV